MTSLAGSIPSVVRDHTQDRNGTELYRIQAVHPFPDFVKAAPLDETLRPEKLAATVYADPVARLYPCHNPASTWLSVAFFTEKRGHYTAPAAERVQRKLDEFVTFWGIKAATDAIKQRDQQIKTASDNELSDSDFAVVYVTDNGVKERHCRIKTATDLQRASDWLHRYRDTLPFVDRNTIARKILNKAASLGASLGQHELFIERQAGRGLCDPAEVRAMIQDRAKLTDNPEQKQAMLKLAETVASQPRSCLAPGTLCKMAQMIDTYDRTIGLSGRYTPTIPRPEDVIFKTALSEIKTATDNAVPLVTGNIYDSTHFKKIALEDIRSLFGDDFVADVADGLDVNPVKLAELAATMPRPDAELFERLLNEAGIPPLAGRS